MKLRSLINFSQAVPVVTGINIHFGEEDNIEISVVVLEQKKQLVQQRLACSSMQSVEQLEEFLTKSIPEGSRLHINIEGRGVLQKTIPGKVHNHQVLMTSIFPMIREDDFVSQMYISTEKNFLHVVRKDVLTTLQPLTQRYAWVSFSLGPLIVAPLVPLLQQREVLIENYKIQIDSGQIVSVSPNSKQDVQPITFAQESISSDLFLAYCSAWYLLLGATSLTFSEWGPETEALGRYHGSIHIHRAGKWALIVLLATLLLNIVLYSYLQTNVINLEAQASFVTNRHKKNTALQKQTKRLLDIYSRIGWRSNLVPVFYADQIALLVPPEIQLTSLDIGVLDDIVLKTERKQVYQSSLIKVKGLTRDPVSLHKLIELLKKYSWVEEIDQHRYRHDVRQNLGVFEFIIRIK